MTRRGSARLVFVVGFVVLLADGAALIWLGQLSASRTMVGVGLALVLCAALLVVAYRRWVAAMDDVDAMRSDLRREVDRLRAAADAARGTRPLD